MSGLRSALAAIVIVALVLLGASGFAAQAGLLAPAEHNRLVAQVDKRPMVFFLAKGPPGSCGPGCAEWIAAEGKFTPGTAQRLRDFLGTLARRDLPIFFHSPGGFTAEGVQTGRILRERRMTASVGRTITEQCRIFAREDPCQRAIVSGGEIKARLRAAEGQCHSACVLAFVGASNRRLSSGATLAVHAVRWDVKARQQAIQRTPSFAEITTADVHRSLEQYLTLMGVDPRLQQLAAKVDPRRLYALSRDEITRFGVDTGEFYETPWATFADAGKRSFALKSVTRLADAERKEHRTVGVQLRCLLGQVWLVYQRELPPNEVGYAALVSVAAGGRELTLRRGQKQDASELWSMPAAGQFLSGATSVPSLVFTEQVIPNDHAKDWTREIKLSTAGLSNVIDGVVKSCEGAQSSGESGAKR